MFSMKSGTMNMTEGNYKRQILMFALPLMFSNLFQQLYNAADSIIVGNFLGKEALAAVSSSGNLIWMMTSFLIGLASGAGIIISRYFGAKDNENLSFAIHTTIFLGIIMGIILTVAGVIFSPAILVAMGTDSSVLPESIKYFRAFFAGGIFISLYNTCNGILNALGDSKRPLYYLVIASIINILLDIIFVGFFHFGVESAALASVMSGAFSVFLCLKHLTKKGTIYQVYLSKIKFHERILRQILNYGVPTGVQNSVVGLANVIVQSHINGFGADTMAGYGVFSKIEGFVFIPITCFAMALATYVGQNLGAGKVERAREGSRFGIILSLILAETIGVLFLFFSDEMVGLFTKDVDVIKYGVMHSHIVCLFFFGLAFSHLVSGVCRGAGKAIVPMFVMLFVWCFVRIVYIIIVTKLKHDIVLIYWAYPLTWCISSTIYLFYYLKSDLWGRRQKLS